MRYFIVGVHLEGFLYESFHLQGRALRRLEELKGSKPWTSLTLSKELTVHNYNGE